MRLSGRHHKPSSPLPHTIATVTCTSRFLKVLSGNPKYQKLAKYQYLALGLKEAPRFIQSGTTCNYGARGLPIPACARKLHSGRKIYKGCLPMQIQTSYPADLVYRTVDEKQSTWNKHAWRPSTVSRNGMHMSKSLHRKSSVPRPYILHRQGGRVILNSKCRSQ